MKKQLVIGLTGPMAAGKNAVQDILESLGYAVIDADKTVHHAVEDGKEAILERFKDEAKEKGIEIQNPDGTINRAELAKIVFENEANLKSQEAIIHPIVNSILNAFIDTRPRMSVVLNATVLYKTPIISRCDMILFVDSPLIVRFFRVIKRDNMSLKQIIARFNAQRKLFAKYKILDTDIYRVWNYGSKKQLRKKIVKLLNSYR